MPGIIDLIGNTPMVELKKLNPNPNVTIYAKLEGDNPGGSVKDRASLNMIRSALERGDIKPGTKLIEATSGNTGIATSSPPCCTPAGSQVLVCMSTLATSATVSMLATTPTTSRPIALARQRRDSGPLRNSLQR